MVTHEGEASQSIVAVHGSGHRQGASDILYRVEAATPQRSLTHDLLSMPVREEVLQAQTPRIEGGEVFVGKEIDIEEKTIMVTVQREDVVIALAGGKTIRLPIARTEPVNIERRPLVTEERIVGKRVVEESEHFTQTVRGEVSHLKRTVL